MKDFYSLFIDELKRIYSAENQMVAAFPSWIEAATHKNLKESFQYHFEETKNHVTRLETIAKELNETLSGFECPIMKALIEENKKVISSDYEANTKDAALITMAQRIEHYEITSYGILKAYAKHFKLENVERLLELTSTEEGAANKKLIDLAEGSFFSRGINTDAHKRRAA